MIKELAQKAKDMSPKCSLWKYNFAEIKMLIACKKAKKLWDTKPGNWECMNYYLACKLKPENIFYIVKYARYLQEMEQNIRNWKGIKQIEKVVI